MSLFNISTLSIKDSGVVQLRNPATDELLYADKDRKKPLEIVVYSSASKQYRDAVTAMQNRALKRGKKQVSAEQMRDEGIKLLAACSVKANNFDLDGMALDTPEAFEELYRRADLSWIREQVDEFLGDVSSFLDESKKV